MKLSLSEELNLIERGTVEILPEGGLLSRLKTVRKENRPLVVKLGADPSAKDLHLGHTVVFRKLRDFQELGHRIVFLIGDFTAMIGDPTGKSKTRYPLTEEEVRSNAKSYEEQIFKVLDRDKTEIVFNSAWNAPLKFADVLNLTSRLTVARILERDDFSKRYKSGDSITLTEVLYGLIQAYDSVHLKADVEIGGTDQKFNLLLGRQLQKDFGLGEGQICVMMPILEGLDGKNKMSKSLSNYVALDDIPSDMFGKLMSIPDVLITKYLTLLTGISRDEISLYESDMQSGEINPRDVKLKLALEIVSMYHGKDAGLNAENDFKNVFSKGKLPSSIPVYRVSSDNVWIVSLLSASGLASSNSEARRLIKGGAVYIDDEKVLKDNISVVPITGMVIRAGKRRFARIELEE